MKTNKTIFFILDSFSLYYYFDKLYNNLECVCCYSYFDTEEAINNKIDNIVTYDIGHLSFDLEDLGYKIFIGYNGKYKHFTVGMSTANGKELRKGHNLIRLLLGGALDNDLGICRPKFCYDNSKSTRELMDDAQIMASIVNNTIGSELYPMKAMSNEESFEWHKKHSRIDPKTGNMIISSDEIGDGTFENKYSK